MDHDILYIVMEIRDRLSALEAEVDNRFSGIEIALAAHSAASEKTAQRVNEIEKYQERQMGFVKISLALLAAGASLVAISRFWHV